MKIFLLLLLLMLATSKSVVGQNVSLASILETRVSISTDAGGITDAVNDLLEATRAEIPEFNRIKFIFENTQKFQSIPSHRMIFKEEKVRRILDIIAVYYKHSVNYDPLKAEVIFVAATGGEDSEREYKFSEDLSRQMNLDWSDEAKAVDSIFKHGVRVNVEKINVRTRSVTLKGQPSELDFLDMVIMVYGRK